MTATADTTVARGTITESLVDRHREIFGKDGFLETYNVERRDVIEITGNALVSGIDPLLLGDAGVGKTWLIELVLQCLEGARKEDFFNTLVFKETPAQDILGPVSPAAMKAGEIARMMDGFLPTAVVGYVDEIFKASPTLLNSMLDLLAQRKLKVGRTIHDCRQLLVIFSSSNELPDREDLGPFRDRLGMTTVVQPVRSPEGRKRVMRIQDSFQASARNVDMSDAPKLTLDEVRQIKSEVSRIILPDAVFETMDKVQERFASAGHPPSQRRIGQMLMAIKARAWTRGESEARTDDVIVVKDMGWNLIDDAKSAHDIVMEFANVFARKASRTREALDPILAQVEEVKAEITANGGEPTEAHDTTTFEMMKQLRLLKRETNEQIESGESQGHDVSDLQSVMSEVTRAHAWVQKTMVGEE